MFSKQVKAKSATLMFKLGVALLVIVFVVVLGPGLLKLESSQALAKKKKGGQFCTQTATAAYKACLNEIQDDYNIAYGNCINVSDSEEREDCFNDAKNGEDGYKAAKGECKDQYEARRDVCEGLGEDRYDPELDPAEFEVLPLTSDNANPYFPLLPGNTWIYHTTKDGEVIETIKVEVLAQTKEIQYPAESDPPFNCIVVRDRVWAGDQSVGGTNADDPFFLIDDLIEYTTDWYAQDNCGNVWYFGEIARNYEDGELVNLDGSWKTGVGGAKPGIVMWNYSPEPGCEEPQEIYRQEFFLGDAEDIAEFVSLGGGELNTKDYTPIEPDVFEIKSYEAGVGLIREVAYEDEVATGEEVGRISGP